MPHRNLLHSEEAHEASWEAARGGMYGALKWGAGAAILGAIGHTTYPLYRGLTIQFKVFLQGSAMIMGGMLEADSRMRMYENRMRLQRRIQQNRAKWDRYEQEVMEEGKNGK